MAILNITFNGLSADYPLHVDERMTDRDIRRIAVEVVRSGEIKGLQISNLSARAFDDYVVDRLSTPRGESRIYLRPKVPFGCSHPRARPPATEGVASCSEEASS